MTYEPPAPPDRFQPPTGPPPGLPYPAGPAPVPAPNSRKALWIILGSVGGVLLLCCIGTVVLGLIVGPPPKTKPAAGTATTTPAAVPTTATAPPSPSPTPSTTPSRAAPTTAAPTKTTAKPAPPNYAAAANILAASDQHYRDQLILGQQAFNTAAFPQWYQREQADLECDDAFKQADAYFTADNEPASMSTWQTDIADATSAFYQWAHAALSGESGAGGPGTVTDQMRGYEQQFNAAIAKADQDVANVGAGK